MIVLGFNARCEDGRDTSWIEEMNWERYSDVLKNVIVYGENALITKRVLIGKGISSLCGVVHEKMGCEVRNGDVFIFIGSSRKLMKLLHKLTL